MCLVIHQDSFPWIKKLMQWGERVSTWKATDVGKQAVILWKTSTTWLNHQNKNPLGAEVKCHQQIYGYTAPCKSIYTPWTSSKFYQIATMNFKIFMMISLDDPTKSGAKLWIGTKRIYGRNTTWTYLVDKVRIHLHLNWQSLSYFALFYKSSGDITPKKTAVIIVAIGGSSKHV